MNGSVCIDERVYCDDLDCFGNCTDTESGGICDDCPIYFEGDGYECFDTRTHCYEMSCFGECAEFESGGVCEPCPFGYNGDGHHCWEKCDEIQSLNGL